MMKVYPDLMKVMRVGKWLDKQNRKEENHSILFGAVLFILAVILATSLAGCEPVFAGVDTTRAVIHHTASHDVSATEINRWHKERGWDGIGYHYVIRKDGSIEKGRSLSKRGAHAKGRNDRVGIVLTGYDDFDVRQISSLKKLLADLSVQNIEKHHGNCPGKGLKLEEVL